MKDLVVYQENEGLGSRIAKLFGDKISSKSLKDKQLNLKLDLEGQDENNDESFNYVRDATIDLEKEKQSINDLQYISQSSKLEVQHTKEERFQNEHDFETRKKKILSIFKDRINNRSISKTKTVTIVQKPENSEINISTFQLTKDNGEKYIDKSNCEFKVNNGIFNSLSLDALVDSFHQYAQPVEAWNNLVRAYNLPNTFLEE